jgi:hypothetical protein
MASTSGRAGGRRFRLDDRTWRRIQLMASVRARLAVVARQVAARTNANLGAADSDAHAEVEEGVRPRGRSYARVQHDDKAGEYGTDHHDRHRALGRAARGGT